MGPARFVGDGCGGSGGGISIMIGRTPCLLWALDMQSKVMRTMLALFAEIEHDLIVARTTEGLAMARLNGSKLDRPKGPGKSKLDPHKDEIVALLRTGSRRNYIAKKFGTSEVNLCLWLKSRGLQDIREEY